MLAPPSPGRFGHDVAIARRLALAVPAALLGGAWGSQIWGGLFPCEICWWQRYPHMVAIALALAALLIRDRPGVSRARIALAALGIAVSGAIGIFHAGVEQGWWEGLTTCSSNGAHSLNEILASPMIRCDQIQFEFLGLSLAVWNAAISLGGAALIGGLLWRGRKVAR